MSRSALALLALAAVLCALSTASCSPDGAVPARPTRPEKFTTQSEVNEYVRKLQEYYSIIGRGRYGKRGLAAPDLARRYLPPASGGSSEMYDFMPQYD